MTLLDDIGGDESLVALVNRFYDLVEPCRRVQPCVVCMGAGTE